MKPNPWWWAGILLALAALACDLGGGGVAPPSGGTPVATQAATAAGEEAPEFAPQIEALNNLDSYAYAFRMSVRGVSVVEGAQASNFSSEGQVQNVPTRAERVRFTDESTGQVTEFIAIQSANNTWTRQNDGEWQALGFYSPEMFGFFTFQFWLEAFFSELPEEADFVGPDLVHGIPSWHYRTSQGGAALGFSGSWENHWWLAVDGGYPVKLTLDAESGAGGESGEIHMSLELRDVNAAMNIAPPI
ncbi:MAG: hypothetical protein HYZ68_01250 [Chloroflexi bacterium]|nr:hypothetical protein [Chloroflexota bacterium]